MIQKESTARMGSLKLTDSLQVMLAWPSAITVCPRDIPRSALSGSQPPCASAPSPPWHRSLRAVSLEQQKEGYVRKLLPTGGFSEEMFCKSPHTFTRFIHCASTCNYVVHRAQGFHMHLWYPHKYVAHTLIQSPHTQHPQTPAEFTPKLRLSDTRQDMCVYILHQSISYIQAVAELRIFCPADRSRSQPGRSNRLNPIWGFYGLAASWSHPEILWRKQWSRIVRQTREILGASS